jgi:hypothetical protein
MAIEPYVEAPTIRTTIQPVSGGIDISEISRFTQGVSNRSVFRQNLSLLPQLGTGRSDFQDFQREYGQSQPYVSSEPFSDTQKLTALAYLEDPDQFNFPIYAGDFLGKDGAIEPLSIRDVASFESIESPFIARAVKGTLMDGNEDFGGNSDRKFSYYEIPKSDQPYDYYLDSGDTIGDISYPGIVGDGQSIVRPFDDTRFPGRKLTNDNDINQKLLAMNPVDDDFLPDQTKASTSGFVYSNSEGTDSLAFGDLLNT